MTVSELKSIVAESPKKGWLQSKSINISYPYINYQLSLTGIPSIYDFILKQLKGYDDLGELSPELIESKIKFENFKAIIFQIVNEIAEDDYKWDNAVNQLGNVNYKIIPSDTSEAEFLARLYQNNRKYYNAAYNFIIENTSYLGKDVFTAYFLTYEFTNKEISKLTERREIEKKSLNRLRSDFQKNLSESETQLAEYLSNANQKVIDKSEEIDAFLESKKDVYQQWFDQTSVNISTYFIRTQEKVNELEELYKDKLKLEAPARYWKRRAKRLKREGYLWVSVLLIFIGIAVILLLRILNMFNDQSLQHVFSSTGVAIKWSILVVTLISFLAFTIRAFSKLTFSSYHLARDAEEREQLTYVYLALQKEKGVDPTERHLVLQSLFSRADTGLLKDEASPTMPGNIVDKIMTK